MEETLLPEIKQAHPEILAKLEQMGGDMGKNQESTRKSGFPNK